MAAKKNTVQTPLHLLQELSQSLLAHLEEACVQAQADAEKLLLKLDRQRGKAQEKLEEARQGLEKAAAAGKAGAQAKARARIEKFELLLDALKASDLDTRNYLAQLKADIQDSLRMAQPIGKAGEAAAQALAAREEAPKAKAPRAPRATKPAAEKAPAKKAPARVAKPKAAAAQ
jgi:ATP-dependent Clp protease ATP-binding subunit ClpA